MTIGELRCSCAATSGSPISSGRGAVGLLKQAADIAAAAHDTDHRVTVLTRLIEARSALGDPAAAAVAFGELAAVAGDAEARAPLPGVPDPRELDARARGGREGPGPRPQELRAVRTASCSSPLVATALPKDWPVPAVERG